MLNYHFTSKPSHFLVNCLIWLTTRIPTSINANQNNNTPPPYSYNHNLLGEATPTQLLQRGHSHNDYHQKHPLTSALKHGLRSIEVDVFPIDGELLVAHTRFELNPEKTIDRMYVQPILSMLQKRGRRIHEPSPEPSTKRKLFSVNISLNAKDSRNMNHSNSPPAPLLVPQSPIMKDMLLTYSSESSHNDHDRLRRQRIQWKRTDNDDSLILLVDFKGDPDTSARLLNKALKPLKPYLSKTRNGRIYKGQVTVLISGNRPQNENVLDDVEDESSSSSSFLRGGGSSSSSTSTSESDDNGNTRSHVEGLGNRLLLQLRQQQQQINDRYMFIDGRRKDLHKNSPNSLVPLISIDWRMIQLARFFGRGESFMQTLADNAHAQGKRLRIWGAPNKEPVWRSMMRSGVDWLSVDNHERFAQFASEDNV